MKFYKYLLYLAFGICLLLPWSCTQDEICLSNQNAVQTGFYSVLSGDNTDTILENSSVYGIDPINDSIYIDESIQSMFLPLSFNSDTTTYVIDNNGLKDTLWFSHTKEMVYISRECGFTFNFTIDSVWFTKVFVDSVFIEVENVNYNESLENVKIYIY